MGTAGAQPQARNRAESLNSSQSLAKAYQHVNNLPPGSTILPGKAMGDLWKSLKAWI
ncbi:unnamed protein product [Penicillium camemberti]|uniref:Str. FM013 n=1 Tax=Penicillium camemberti (strain FM 013) TaxID=1429867 RepID=A0A0G4PS62_PENC3|nr:unnamed protein product [Penicillium camemberti]